MQHDTAPPLTSIQQQVLDSLAAGSTLSAAAAAHDLHRITIYGWMQTLPQFAAELEHQRAEFVLARRDELHLLETRALSSLAKILDDPHASSALLFKAAKLVLERNQSKCAWSIVEPYPTFRGKPFLDSATLEREANRVPDSYLSCNQDKIEPENAHEPPACNTMQHKNGFSKPPVAPKSAAPQRQPVASASQPYPPEIANKLKGLDAYGREALLRNWRPKHTSGD